jgi:multidrug efflux pump subunit AcrA (membrane-fusion protein)
VQEKSTMSRTGIRLAIIGGVIIGLAACNNQQPAAHLSPPEVTVSKPAQKDIVNWGEFTGGMAAVNFVKITPRVSGYIVDIPFNEGDIVHKGDVLFQIDPRPYQHAYEQAVGQLQQAKANQQLQEVTFTRQQKLRDTAVIAKEDYVWDHATHRNLPIGDGSEYCSSSGSESCSNRGASITGGGEEYRDHDAKTVARYSDGDWVNIKE